MEFGDWELNNALWEDTRGAGVAQESLPERRARLARQRALSDLEVAVAEAVAAAAAVAATATTGEAGGGGDAPLFT